MSSPEHMAEPISVDGDTANSENGKKGEEGMQDMDMNREHVEDVESVEEAAGDETKKRKEPATEESLLVVHKTEVENKDPITDYPEMLFEEEPQVVEGDKNGADELLEKILHSEEEAYKMYCDYAHTHGFSVRKGKQYYHFGTKNLRCKEYYCSKAGMGEGEITAKKLNKPTGRTNCKAMVRFKVSEDGQWRVVYFVGDHNHKLLTDPYKRHLLRSNRNLLIGKELEAIKAAEAMIKDAVSSSIDGSGGTSSKRDLGTLFNLRKAPRIKGEDSQSLVTHFKSRSNEDGMYFWDVQLDQAGRMTSFFWRDGRSRIDYDCFGDVVVFDSTFRTNKYNIICAPFVGVNHHWQNIMFGCAFVVDESVESFVWLFRSFLESMGGQPPKSILTNQDQDMAKAIEQVFPHTHHRIAQWHIQKDALTFLGHLSNSKAFEKIFNKCLRGCDSELMFEETWVKMLLDFKLQDNHWLNKLYNLRDKWCTALNKDSFDGGVELEPQSVCMSNMFKGIADKSTSLSMVVTAVEKLSADWREKEFDEDLRCCQKPLVCVIKHSEILNYAAKVYTHRVYKLFETEYLDGCGATFFKELSCSGASYTFEMTTHGRASGACTVVFDISTLQLICSCSKFEMMGLLCSHALKALMVKNVSVLPQNYLLKRWSKDARKEVYGHTHDDLLQHEPGAELAFCNLAMQYAYDLVLKSQGEEESRRMFWDTLESGEKALERFCDFRSFRSHALLPRQ